jgi:prevent-host-death family protein
MVRMKAAKAREQFSSTLDRVVKNGERVVLERKGKRVAALVPLEDLELIERLEDEIDVREARKALADKSPSVPWEQVKRELGL